MQHNIFGTATALGNHDFVELYCQDTLITKTKPLREDFFSIRYGLTEYKYYAGLSRTIQRQQNPNFSIEMSTKKAVFFVAFTKSSRRFQVRFKALYQALV